MRNQMVDHVEPLAPGTAPAPPERAVFRRSWLVRTWGRALDEAVLFPIVALFLLGVVASLPSELLSDSWLVLLGGKEIVRHGLPAHDALTIWGHGREWIDQQWLGQLFFYGLYALGGIRLVLLAHSAAVGAAFVMAIVAARSRGASMRSVCWIALPVVFVLSWGSWNARAQSLALVLFVSLTWLLVRDARAPTRKTFLVLPILAVWANVHGTAFTGALFVVLRGVTYGLERRGHPWRSWVPRTTLFCLAPIGCLLASPYAAKLPTYYVHVLSNPGFRQFVTEWKPTSLSLQTAPLFALAFAAVWLLGRRGDRLVRFEQALLVLTLVMALQTIRSAIWFALTALILLPTALDGVLQPNAAAMRFRLLNRMLVALSVTAILVGTAAVAAKPTSWFESGYPSGVLAAVDRVTKERPQVRVFANEQFGDWLLLKRPALGGRLAFDIRFELLSRSQLQQLVNARRRVQGWRTTLAPYGLFVLRTGPEGALARDLLRSGSVGVRYRGHGAIVLARSASEVDP